MRLVALALCLLAAGATGVALQRPTADAQSTTKSPAAKAASGKALPILWEDLLPEGEEERIMQLYEAFYLNLERQAKASGQPGGLGIIAEGSAADSMPQIGTYNTVAALEGRKVRLPGYIVPFDFNAGDKFTEFLLVPYFGACIHTPPPPPNQIIYVKASPAAKIDDVWAPVWLEGVLTGRQHKNDLGNAAYTLDLTKLEPYED
ncbi:DUF3299 domain-containing protein [bacterium]|nr:DUF3299 domain-containing protein [bacterium]